MRTLRYTLGSPYARGIRVLLQELGLEYEQEAELTTPSAAERATASPTLQVPTLWDDGKTLWESGLIADYLLATYSVDSIGPQPLAGSIARAGSDWEDKLLLATIQTLGNVATTISQMKWSGVAWQDNDYLTRGSERLPYLLDWLEARLLDTETGFLGNVTAVQDIFLTCHLRFIANRPLDLDCKLEKFPKIKALTERMEARTSFIENPILWWDPKVIGYAEDGTTPLYNTD
ncbi:MAG: glutathione S-transferase [Sneathiella sp.]|nr:MAG: glutathione S-transferase [Sneathiella sp.]